MYVDREMFFRYTIQRYTGIKSMTVMAGYTNAMLGFFWFVAHHLQTGVEVVLYMFAIYR